MKNLVSLHILCLLFLIACANNNQIPESLSSSYDGIWDGYAQTSKERVYIKGEIKNGIVSGSAGDTKINGYISFDNNLFINPIYSYMGGVSGNYAPPDKIVIETNLMSPDRIEGTYYADRLAQKSKYDWYVVKPATGKSGSTISTQDK